MAKGGPGLIADPAGRFLPWIIAFLVYIAGLSLTGALALQEAAQAWRAGLSGTLTVEVSPIVDEDEAGMQARLERALALIRATPGVEAAEPIPGDAVRELLTPWLGPSLDVATLPLPRLIDIDLAESSGFDAAGLDARLNAAVPGARVDDHAVWRDRLVRALRAMQVTGFAIVTVLLIATVAMVVFATRGGLAAQRDVVELLHLIGATDGFIARQFQRHALRHALIGGTGGALAGAATIVILGLAASDLDVAPGGTRLIDWPTWVALALTPPAAGGLALWAARRTVLATLARMT